MYLLIAFFPLQNYRKTKTSHRYVFFLKSVKLIGMHLYWNFLKFIHWKILFLEIEGWFEKKPIVFRIIILNKCTYVSICYNCIKDWRNVDVIWNEGTKSSVFRHLKIEKFCKGIISYIADTFDVDNFHHPLQQFDPHLTPGDTGSCQVHSSNFHQLGMSSVCVM